ncbi:uncharacterized protein LOC110457324 [Mizuhopecten yessoensis]|uniref:uncharacterized protein LOC110457324 n=1 Tax=Mizuhopecten yessoensis TaxID=6573 RepID=UPI000B45D935|nr:uncharacterized protein LOC110457324 [Mizuhopecten yessoensis]
MMLGAVLLVCLCFLAVSDSKPARAVPFKTDAVKSTYYSPDDGLMKIISLGNGRTKRAVDNKITDLDEIQILKRLHELRELTKRRRRRHRCRTSSCKSDNAV